MSEHLHIALIVNHKNISNPHTPLPPTPNHLDNNLLAEHLGRCTRGATAHVKCSDAFTISTSVLLGIKKGPEHKDSTALMLWQTAVENSTFTHSDATEMPYTDSQWQYFHN